MDCDFAFPKSITKVSPKYHQVRANITTKLHSKTLADGQRRQEVEVRCVLSSLEKKNGSAKKKKKLPHKDSNLESPDP